MYSPGTAGYSPDCAGERQQAQFLGDHMGSLAGGHQLLQRLFEHDLEGSAQMFEGAMASSVKSFSDRGF
jgi:hypothetical protein